MHDPYAALVTLAERERSLIDDGRLDELEALAAERAALVASLPPQAPSWARPALERARALQLATTAVLQASVTELRHQMVALERGRGVAHAYVAGPPAAPVSRLNTAA